MKSTCSLSENLKAKAFMVHRILQKMPNSGNIINFLNVRAVPKKSEFREDMEKLKSAVRNATQNLFERVSRICLAM